MTMQQQILTIMMVVVGTMLTRFLPFIIFPEGTEAPDYITYLGRVLPHAVIGMLIVFCLKDAILANYHGIPEALASFFIFILHKWKKSTLLSIAGGSALYMMMVQNIFV